MHKHNRVSHVRTYMYMHSHPQRKSPSRVYVVGMRERERVCVCVCVCVFEKEEYSIGWKTCPHSREWPKYLHYFSPKFFSGVSINTYRFLVIRGVPYLSS